ncbi:MAG: tetratricopeptide repeat protein [Saprospiraceae bacterium]|nr:tetratricopeptide repeat protein [Saprospiraceae bacterium]
MFRKLFQLAVLSLATMPLIAQQSTADSLRSLFVKEKDPLKKAYFYYDLADFLMKEKPEAGLAFADTLEQLAKAARDPKSRARVEILRGYSLYEQGKYADAMPPYKRALAIAMQTTDLELQGKALNSVGNVFHNIGRNDSAIVYLTQSAKIKEELGNMKDVAAVYSNIGNVFSDEKSPDKAIEWLQKSLAIRLSLPDGEKGAIVCYNNLSVAYNGKEDYDKAIEYAQRGFDLAMQTGNKFHAGVLAGSLGHLWLEKRNLDKSIEMSNLAVQLLTETNRRSNLVFPYTNLSEAWWRKGNYQKALETNQLGYAIMEELKLIEPLEVYYENFANVYESMGDHKQALVWFKKFMVLDDSLFNKEKLEAIAEVEAKFETEKKEAQLARQKLDLERQSSQKRTILISAIAAMLALGGGFQYLRSKQRIKQKEAELAAQLEHAEADKLREMDTLKSTFFANISHEFRTPLTLIVSPLEQMINGSFQGDFQKYYRIMHRNGKRLLDLVNQLLDLSRLEGGKLKLQVAEGDLVGFVKAVAYSFESLAMRKQIDYQIIVEERPAASYFDKDKVEKILSNLISNAFKFTNDGGRIEVRMTMDYSQRSGDKSGGDFKSPPDLGTIVNRQSSIQIKDNGMGIPADQLPHIFERFAKTVTSELQPGSGIGLALTKELVELHKGKIEVESREGEGTIFTVILPVDRDAFDEHEINLSTPNVLEQPAISTSETTSGVKATIPISTDFQSAILQPQSPILLVVEDNPDVRNYIADQFREQYQIIEAENGRLGLEKALETTPDLVISDIMMPEMDGTEFCKQLKINEKTSHIPVVMLTALAEQGDRIKGLELGADDYLIKPFDAKELTVRVANLIAGRQKLQEHYRRSLNSFAPIAELKAESVDAVFLKKVREAVEANMEEESFSVVELGAQVGMSRSQLHRKLSALTGFSPNEVIRNMRLEKAKQLLEKRVGNASEVAYMTGFNSPAYFAKCFKDYFGVTPSEV